MIARTHRFHGYGSLNPVYRRGQTLREPSINLKFLARRPGQPGRVAVVVSKKVSKSAVVRNRIRRRIYETLRKQETEKNDYIDMVFTVFSDEIASQDQKKLDATIKSLVQTAVELSKNEPRNSRPSRGIVKPEGEK